MSEAVLSLPHTSSRKVALERNEAKNFDEGPAYDIQGGHPITKDMPSQTYKAQPFVSPADNAPASGPAPFTLKGA